ncbi:anthranilate phosphoribosyltransferase [Thermicanus aegyptius]|uniref:anthranilate phosphoribosyltransferase n=1 Tax=Thermicanus aegyptius TaxID=94009 RepID=UPI00040F2F16|nr:anthranilate phosphoribosyltransferase [Thermicanus aegyptius]
MLTQVLKKVVEGENLTRQEAKEAMDQIMGGEATPAQIGSLLTALKMKGETVEEILGFAQSMREHAVKIEADEKAIDTAGTGGDGAKTFNVSTAAAIVAAAGGAKVVKHGNRALSSRSGSADVLEELGIPIGLGPEEAKEMLEETNLCFLFAPVYHQAMKHAAGPRKEIGFRTLMNLLGPLTNPAGVKRQIIGVFDPSYARRLARVLRELGSEHVLILSSHDGLDEISVSALTRVVELKGGELYEFEISPEELGLTLYPAGSYSTGSAKENAETMIEIFRGKENADGEIVLANAGAALYVAGLASSIREGVERSREIIQSGLAMEQLRRLQNAGKKRLFA